MNKTETPQDNSVKSVDSSLSERARNQAVSENGATGQESALVSKGGGSEDVSVEYSALIENENPAKSKEEKSDEKVVLQPGEKAEDERQDSNSESVEAAVDSTIVEATEVQETDDDSDAVIAEAGSDGGSLLGYLGLGLLGIGGAAAGGGGGGGGGSVVAAVAQSVSGGLVMGPVIDGHGLSYAVYKAEDINADGSIKANAVALASGPLSAGGTFQVTDIDYVGAAVVRVTDNDSPEVTLDYMDEATGQAKDLTVDELNALTVLDGSANQVVNINVFTQAAYELLLDSQRELTDQNIQSANKQVTDAIGLTEDIVTGTTPVAVIDTNGDANTEANTYGKLLAAASGVDESGDTATTISQLKASITGTDNPVVATANLLLVGAANVEDVLPGFADEAEMTLSDFFFIADALNKLRIELQTQITGNESEIASLIDDSVTHGGTATLASLAGVAAAIVNLQATGTDSAAAITALQTELAAATTEMTNYIDTAIAALDADLQAQIDSNDVDIAGLTTDLAALSAAVTTLSSTTSEDVTALQTQLTGITGSVKTYIDNAISTLDTDLQAQITSNDSDIASLIDDSAANEGTATLASIAGLSAAITALQTAVGGSDSDIAALQTQLAGITGSVKTYIDNAISTLDTDLQGQITSNDSDIASLIDDSEGVEGEDGYVAPTTGSIAGLKAAIDALASASGTDVSALQSDVAALEASITNLQAQIDAIVKPSLITANELDNHVELFDYESASIRVELGAGNDTLNSFSGDTEIVGQLGADVINLTSADSSQDKVIYQTVFDGQALPISTVTFSTDAADYREGAVLTLTLNGTEYSYTVNTDEGESVQTALQGLADLLPSNTVTVQVNAPDATLKLIGASSASVLTVAAGGDVEAAISNSGVTTKVDVAFSGTAADWPTLTNDGHTTEFSRQLYVTIDGTQVSANVVYVEGVVDINASVAALVTAVNNDEAVSGAVTASSSGSTLTLVGDTIPVTDADAPTFTVDSAMLDQNGTQQVTKVNFSTDNADYYEGGTLSATVNGTVYTANMVAGNAGASVAALRAVIEEAGLVSLESVSQGSTYGSGISFSSQTWLSYPGGETNYYTNIDGYMTDGVLAVANSYWFDGKTISVSEADLLTANVTPVLFDTDTSRIIFASWTDFEAAWRVAFNRQLDNITVSVSQTDSETTAITIRDTDLSSPPGSSSFTFYPAQQQPSLVLTAASEADGTLDTEGTALVSEAKMDYSGEYQTATATLETASQYTTYTDGTDPTDNSRPANVYYEGGKAYITIAAVDAQGVADSANAVTVSADMAGAAVKQVEFNEPTDNWSNGVTLASTLTADDFMVWIFAGPGEAKAQYHSIEGETVADFLARLEAGSYIADVRFTDQATATDGNASLTITLADNTVTGVRVYHIGSDLASEHGPETLTQAALTTQALADAINAEAQLDGIVSGATVDANGNLLLTGTELARETFEISDISLDYQGVKQLASVSFSTTDADYYSGGTLSLTLDTTPGVAGDSENDITIIADMVDGDAAGSIAALQTAVDTAITNNNAGLGDLLASTSVDGNTLTLTSASNTEHAFDISNAEISYTGIKQQATATFSTAGSDYYSGGTIALELSTYAMEAGVTQTFTQAMVAGDAAATLAALQAQIETAASDQAATITIPTSGTVTDSTALGLASISVAFNGGSLQAIDMTGITTVGAFRTLLETYTEIASTAIVAGGIEVTTSATGVSASIAFDGSVNDGGNSSALIAAQSTDVASGTDASLLGLEAVSLSNGTLTFTADDPQDGAAAMTVESVSTKIEAVTQVSELLFDGMTDADFYAIDDDGQAGTVSVDIAGTTVTANMGDTKAATINNLQQQIIGLRDGRAAEAEQPATAATVSITGDFGPTDSITQVDLAISNADGVIASLTADSTYTTLGELVIYIDGLTGVAASITSGKITISSESTGSAQSLNVDLTVNNSGGLLFSEEGLTDSGTDLVPAVTEIVQDANIAAALGQVTIVETLVGNPTSEFFWGVRTSLGVSAELAFDNSVLDTSLTQYDGFRPSAVTIDGETFAVSHSYTSLADYAADAQAYFREALSNDSFTVTATDPSPFWGVDYTELQFASNNGSDILFDQETSPSLSFSDFTVEGVQLTAASGGVDPLNVDNVAYTTPYIYGSKHEVTIQFSNSYLDSAEILNETLSLTLDGITTTLTVDQTLLDGITGDQSEGIVAALLQQVIADHTGTGSQLDPNVSGTTAIAEVDSLNPNKLHFVANERGVNLLGQTSISVTQDDGTANNLAAAILEVIDPGVDDIADTSVTATTEISINDNNGEGNAVDGVDEYTASITSANESNDGGLNLNQESVSGDANDPIAQTTTNAGDNGDYYGDSASTGDGNGVDQSYSNPDSGYDATAGSAQTNVSSTNTGDAGLYGGAPGYYDGSDDTLYMNDRTTADANVLDILDGTNGGGISGASETTLTDSDSAEDNLAVTQDDSGLAAYEWDESVVTRLNTYSSAAPDTINNFQVYNGEVVNDLIQLEGDLARTTQPGAEATTVLASDSTTVDLSADSFGLISSADNAAQTTLVGDMASLSFTVYPVGNGGIYGTHQSVGNSYINISVDGGDSYTTYWLRDGETLQTAVDAINTDGSILADAGEGSLDFTATSATQQLDVQLSLSMGWSDPGVIDGVIAGSYSATSSADPLAVTASELQSAEDIAALLNGLFDFSGTTENGTLNTSVFAVTASDDTTQTAIWSHTQSSAADNTIEGNELNLLAVVNTTGDEFSANNLVIDQSFIV